MKNIVLDITIIMLGLRAPGIEDKTDDTDCF